MGQKWEKIGQIPIFHRPTFPIFPEVKDLYHSSVCKIQLIALTDGKMGISVTHQPSPPRRLQMLGGYIRGWRRLEERPGATVIWRSLSGGRGPEFPMSLTCLPTGAAAWRDVTPRGV